MKLIHVVLFTLLTIGQCYKILLIFPIPSQSHYFLGNALGKGLAKAGHDVTMLSPYEKKDDTKNYKNIVLTGFKEEKPVISVFDIGNFHPWLAAIFLNSIGNTVVKSTFEHPNFKKLLNDSFDVIIIEQFKNDALKVLQCHFQAPLIIFSTVGPNVWVNSDVGNPSPPSYIPDMHLSYSSDMNLWQRTYNSITTVFHLLNDHFLFFPSQMELAKFHFPKCTNNQLALSNVSLTFLNSHESFSYPVPIVPNMIKIGGFHIDPPKGLPTDLKEYLDNAKNGVIYFSMGSNVPSSEIRSDVKEAILKVLGKLDQQILWKYDQDTLPGKPENIKLGKWFPQSDILAHPNTKLFITHGGLLSTIETIHHGVPVLTLPVFGDQKMNAARAATFGYGLKLLFSEITEASFSKAINELLNNPKYQKNVKLRSSFYHDRPMKPMDLAVYWTEFIARHKGASHLRVAGLNLAWHQYLLVDVVLFVGLFTSVIFVTIYMVLKKLSCSRKGKKKTD